MILIFHLSDNLAFSIDESYTSVPLQTFASLHQEADLCDLFGTEILNSVIVASILTCNHIRFLSVLQFVLNAMNVNTPFWSFCVSSSSGCGIDNDRVNDANHSEDRRSKIPLRLNRPSAKVNGVKAPYENR